MDRQRLTASRRAVVGLRRVRQAEVVVERNALLRELGKDGRRLGRVEVCAAVSPTRAWSHDTLPTGVLEPNLNEAVEDLAGDDGAIDEGRVRRAGVVGRLGEGAGSGRGELLGDGRERGRRASEENKGGGSEHRGGLGMCPLHTTSLYAEQTSRS